jgi:hypothetical protein
MEAAAYRSGGEVYREVYKLVLKAIGDTSGGSRMQSNSVKQSKMRISHQIPNVSVVSPPMLPMTIPSVSGGFRGQGIDW